MAWSSAALTAQEIADFAADYPILVGKTIGDSLADARMNTGGSLSSTDHAATGYAASNAFDRRASEITKPDANVTTVYLMLDAGASPADVDMAMVIGHNFSSVGVTQVDLQVDDVPAFGGGGSTLQTVKTWTTGFTSRLAAYSLFHTGSAALRYSSARYWRLKIQMASGVPTIGELWLGRRRQLSTAPIIPYDEKEQVSRISDFVADDGSTMRYKWSSKQFRKKPRFMVKTTTEVTTIDSWWSDCDGGTKPSLYCENPSSAPTVTHIVLPSGPSLVKPTLARKVSDSRDTRPWEPEFEECDTYQASDS